MKRGVIFVICCFVGLSVNAQDSAPVLEDFNFSNAPVVLPKPFLQTLLFIPLETQIDVMYNPYLDMIGKTLQQHPDWFLVCRSFCDNSIEKKNAIVLTQARFYNLQSYFVRRGFEPARIHLVASGADMPLAIGNTEDEKKRLNRIELSFGQ